MPVRALTREDLRVVAGNMRTVDHREIFATRFDSDVESLVSDIIDSDPIGAIIAAPDGVAVAALGGIEMWPGNWSVWMFATDRWPEVARSTTRFVRRVLWPTLQQLGLRRAECRSALAHPIAHRWLQSLGAELEAVYPVFGRNGETFLGFVMYGDADMCATPKKRKRGRSKAQEASVVPTPTDMVADEAAEQELRRLRALYGRRATILTSGAQALGNAPVAQNRLLGS